MNDTNGFGSQVGIIGSGRMFYVGSVFVLNIGLARLMGPEGFGTFQQVFMFSALFMIMTLGVPETLYYFMPRLEGVERARLLGGTLAVLAIVGAAIAILFWFGAPLLARLQHNSSIVPHLRTFGIYGACIVAASFADPVFIMLDRMRLLFALSALHGCFFLALMAWYWVDRPSMGALFGAMAVFGAGKYLLAAGILARVLPADGFSLPRDIATVLAQLGMAVPLALSSTIDIISRWLDKFVVSYFFGAEAVGLFYVGAIEIPFVAVFIASVYNVISPRLNALHHAGDIPGFAAAVRQTLAINAAFIWPVWLFLLIFADRFIAALFTVNYLPASTLFRVYLAMMPFRIISFGTLLLAVGRPRAVFWGAAAALTANAILNVVLALTIGFIGPAIATVAATYLHVVIMSAVLVRTLDVPIGSLLPVRTLGKIALAALAAGIAAIAVGSRIANDTVSVLWSALVFGLVYLVLARHTGVFRRRTISMAGGQ